MIFMLATSNFIIFIVARDLTQVKNKKKPPHQKNTFTAILTYRYVKMGLYWLFIPMHADKKPLECPLCRFIPTILNISSSAHGCTALVRLGFGTLLAGLW